MRQRAAGTRALVCRRGGSGHLLRAPPLKLGSATLFGGSKRRPFSSSSAADSPAGDEAPVLASTTTSSVSSSTSTSSTTTSTSPTPAPAPASRGDMRDGAKWTSGQAGGRPHQQQQPQQQGSRGDQQRRQQQHQQHRQRQRQQNTDSTARSPNELPTHQTNARATDGRSAAGGAAVTTAADQRPDAPWQQEEAAASEDDGGDLGGGGGGIPQPRPWFQRESPEVGYVYRRYRETKPSHAERRVKPLPQLSSAIWKPLELTLPQQTVPPPVEIPVARLAHGLKRVVLNEGVHPLRDFATHKFLFSPFLSKIHQPENINYNSMPPFITTSKDKILHKLAAEHGVKYKGSTSSMSPTLAQIYRLLSNFKGPSFPQMSPYYRNKPANFTKTSVKPVCLFLRPVDGIYSIDSDPGNIPIAANQILLDLGKSLERMLTTEPQDFKREFLLSGKPTGQYSGPEAYHYLKMGDFLLRSQLDCHEPDMPGKHKTFDLKTRATTMVRRNMLKYQKYLKYKLTCLQGGMYSYEREFYDICRAAMLKYWYQVRIGKMDGIFVAYHNTAEIFGFEYLKAEEMERVLFGNSELAEVAFQVPMRLWQNILNEITARAPPNKTLRVVLNTDKSEKELDVFVEPVEFDSGWLEPAMSVSSGDIGMISAKTNGYGYISQTIQRSSMLNPDNPPNPELELERYEWLKVGKLQPSLNHYKLRLVTFVNGQPTEDRPLQYQLGDRLDVFYNLTDVTGTTEKTILKMLQSYKYLLSKSLLYSREEEEEEKLLDGAAEEDADTDEE